MWLQNFSSWKIDLNELQIKTASLLEITGVSVDTLSAKKVLKNHMYMDLHIEFDNVHFYLKRKKVSTY